jgi:hypothetical protein
LYIHGGVSFTPYKERFSQLIKSSSMNYMETYNASEGFIGIQDRLGASDMLLMLDYGIYYEFMPMSEYGKEFPVTYSLNEVKLHENYALVISTNAGLWRYIIGDTIRFTSMHPFRFKIAGRTKHYINAFGEELVIENADQAIAKACAASQSSIADYTACPIYFNANSNGGHEWLIEFNQAPEDLSLFAQILDQELKALNSDYEAKRYKDIAMMPPKITVLPKGTFHSWLKEAGKLGGQHKIPRLGNDRTFVEAIKQMILQA